MSKIYIDAGHGGYDNGAVKYLVEDEKNLKIAKGCKAYLEKYGQNVKMSRENDTYKSLNDRTAEANSYNCDFAVSIHNNAGGGDGAECYHSICYGKGKTLSDNILAEITKLGQQSRGSKVRKGANGDYYGFIRNTTMPAVIVECAFVDNINDAKIIDTDEECVAMGEAIARGILKSLGVATTTTKPATTTKPKENTSKSFLVKVTCSALNIRHGAGTNFPVVGVIRDRGTYTITETKNGFGRLKSGLGWICLDYTKKV